MVLRTHGLVLGCSLGVLALAPDIAAGFEPVYLPGPAPSIAARVIGRFDGGFYLTSAASTPPAYDKVRKRLHVISQRRFAVEGLDINDPSHPHRASRIDLKDFVDAFSDGGLSHLDPPDLHPDELLDPDELRDLDLFGEIRSVAFSDEVLAVALAALDKNSRGYLFLFNEDDDPIAEPVKVGVGPNAMAFTPDGGTLVLANTAARAEGDDPTGSISVVRIGSRDQKQLNPDVKDVGFHQFNGLRQLLAAGGARVYGPGATVAENLEPEAVAIAADSGTAWVSLTRNNAIAQIDLHLRHAVALHGLGTRDLNLPGQGIDASDRDGGIVIRNWPVFAFFGPDGIGALENGSGTWLVTANEGDPREFEEARVAELALDPSAFTQAATLQQEANLGRLRVTRLAGDPDGDGDYDRLYTLGTRSFAIWTTAGQLVFDSGDAFERITAAAVPQFFNTSEDANGFDGRSADRGPEPEPLTLGRIGGRDYAFVGLERIGGVIAYDVTDPGAPSFQFYLNNRNFAVDPRLVCERDREKSDVCAAVGDLEPEALLFIPAEDSPNGGPFLVVTHEKSDSVTILQLSPAAAN